MTPNVKGLARRVKIGEVHFSSFTTEPNYDQMKKIFLSLVLSFFYLSCYCQLANPVNLTSDNKLLGLGERHVISSEILNEDRPIIISLPVGYEAEQSNYPVIYVLDGLENIKHTVGTIELLSESGLIAPLIIVGIQSLDRARDLTPSNAGQNVYGGTGNAGISQSGGASKFLSFIENELIPYIETNYKTHPFRILEGHSFGGLFCVYAMMNKPNVFDAFIIEAPALWWNNEEMTEQAKEFFKENASFDKTVYFGVGGNEGWGMRQELIRYVDVIKEKEPKDLRWKHEEVGDEDHMSSRLLLNYNGLKFLFSDLRIDEKLKMEYTDHAFLKAEESLMEKYGQNARRPAGDYVDLVLKLEGEDNLQGAITILERATKAYPNYIGLLTYLVKLYEKTDQIEKAINTIKTGIEVSKRYKLGQEDDLIMELDRLKGKN